MKNTDTKKITNLALMSAMALVLSIFIAFPLVPSVAFLQFDPKDIVIAITGFIYGPVDASNVSVIAAFLQILFKGGNIIDVLMDVISSLTFVLPACILYKKIHSKNGAFIGLIAGMALNCLAMVLWNYVVTPMYYQMPREAVVTMLPAIALFNILKTSINSGITLLIYKPVVTALRKSGLVPKSEHVSSSKSLATAGAFALVTVALVYIALNGII